MTATMNTPLSLKRLKRRTIRSGQTVQVLAMLKRMEAKRG